MRSKSEQTQVHTKRITTYEEFHAYLDRFGKGLLNFLIVIGPGGVGKTQAVKKMCPGIHCLEGRLSPAAFYEICHSCSPDTPICLSDINMADLKANQSQLRQLTETTPEKTMHWNTKGTHYPSFKTRSKLIILTNKWDGSSEEAQALATRASTVINFTPSAEEVHRQVFEGGWFHDQEVFDSIQSLLHLIKKPSFRHYRMASDLRKAELPWESTLLEWFIGSEKMRGVAEIMKKGSLTVSEQAALAEELGICCERTFYRLKKEIGTVALPKLTEKMVLPPEPPQLSLDEHLSAKEPTDGEAIADNDSDPSQLEEASLPSTASIPENQNQCQSVSAIADKLPTKSKAAKKRGRPKKPR